jgi:hypothetical protein
MTARARKLCKDCTVEDPTGKQAARRTAVHPGPRCHTHHNQRKREVRLANHGRRVQSVYSISAQQYAALLEFQGGRCAICRRATGQRKRLAVDHDHSCCPGPTSCGNCVRMLLCSACNDVLAHFRDDPLSLERAAANLRQWPSRLAGLVPPEGDSSRALPAGSRSRTDAPSFIPRAKS